MESKYLIGARNARKENNSEDAKKFYDLVRTDDPENLEARFFYSFYSLQAGTNGEIPNRFLELCRTTISVIEDLSKKEDNDEYKQSLLKEIVDTFVPETWTIYAYTVDLTVGEGNNRVNVIGADKRDRICKEGVKTLYALGDLITSGFSNLPQAKKLAVAAWKEGVFLSQKWYGSFKKEVTEEYAYKIKKVDPNYEMPKKAGCIQVAGKR